MREHARKKRLFLAERLEVGGFGRRLDVAGALACSQSIGFAPR